MIYDNLLGCFIGLAIGDALGAPIEFSAPGTFEPVTSYRSGGPFNLPAGYWTDDTSMAIALGTSLTRCGALNLVDQMDSYVEWYRNGKYSSVKECFDIGVGTAKALDDYIAKGLSPRPSDSCGNGSLMRLAPVPMFFIRESEQTVRLNCELSASTTHGGEAILLTGEFGSLLYRAMHGESKQELKTNLVDYSDPNFIKNSGYVVESFRSALYCFHSTNDFESCVLKAVNYGDDADTVGAIAGQLAGAYYGLNNIPSWMTEGLHDFPYLLYIAKKLALGPAS